MNVPTFVCWTFWIPFRFRTGWAQIYLLIRTDMIIISSIIYLDCVSNSLFFLFFTLSIRMCMLNYLLDFGKWDIFFLLCRGLNIASDCTERGVINNTNKAKKTEVKQRNLKTMKEIWMCLNGFLFFLAFVSMSLHPTDGEMRFYSIGFMTVFYGRNLTLHWMKQNRFVRCNEIDSFITCF